MTVNTKIRNVECEKINKEKIITVDGYIVFRISPSRIKFLNSLKHMDMYKFNPNSISLYKAILLNGLEKIGIFYDVDNTTAKINHKILLDLLEIIK